MAAGGECVKVIVRCRPMNTREKDLNCGCVIKMEGNRAQCAITNPGDKKAPPKSFTFDGAYFTDSTTENIYNEIAYPLVEGVTEGYNGTIFAYGQTGCGKSFTMQGITDPPTQRGIIPRAFDHVFETVSVADSTKFLIHASYCEIYNEEIRDLLGKDIKAKLDLHEHPEKGVYVNGLSHHPVHSVVECNKIMEKGWKNRSTGATLMNADSSRSHSIFTIMLEMMTPDDEGEEHIRAGKLNLVDLAGSERQAKTGATGDRLKEATKINLSLSALGNVISALVDGKSKHIPYRDSKLTRLLQDSLGGNTKTLMVACLSPADNNYDESLSTLRYANRAKNIKNKPKINEDPKDALLRQYQEEIERLKAMLMGQIPVPAGGFEGVSVPAGDSRQSVHKPQDDTAREELEMEKEKIKEEYDRKLEDMKKQYEEEKSSKDNLEKDMKKLRAFYDGKISNLDGQIEKLPTTAENRRLKASDQQMRMMALALEQFKMATASHMMPQKGSTKGLAKVLGDGAEDYEIEGDSLNDTYTVKKGRKGEKEAKDEDKVVAVVVVKNADGTARTDAEGKVITKKEIITRTEYIEREQNGEVMERPMSVMGENLPEGPGIAEQNYVDDDYQEDFDQTEEIEGEAPYPVTDDGEETSQFMDSQVVGSSPGVAAPQALVPTQAKSQTPVQYPDQDKKVTIVNGQMVIRSTQPGGDEGILVRPTTAGRGARPAEQQQVAPSGKEDSMPPGSTAPRSSPTHSSMQEQLRFQQNEAMKRLQELEQQMVGGENKENKEVKDRRSKRKRFAEERKRRLAEAIANMDDDGIMLDIYDNIGDELKAKNKVLEKEKEKRESAEREIIDIQSEFEFERIDYLDTIRKQEKQMKLLQEIIDRIHPCLRKDCNYANLDRIRLQCKWDEDESKWIMPQMKIEKTALPVTGTTLPGGMGGNTSPRMTNGEQFDDRYRSCSSGSSESESKIMKSQDRSGQYFNAKRQSQLVSEPLNKVDISEVKKSYNLPSQPGLPTMANGFGRSSLTGMEEPVSNGLKAAKVHGQVMQEDAMVRKPTRLEALNPIGKKEKKKSRKNNYDGY